MILSVFLIQINYISIQYTKIYLTIFFGNVKSKCFELSLNAEKSRWVHKCNFLNWYCTSQLDPITVLHISLLLWSMGKTEIRNVNMKEWNLLFKFWHGFACIKLTAHYSTCISSYDWTMKLQKFRFLQKYCKFRDSLIMWWCTYFWSF